MTLNDFFFSFSPKKNNAIGYRFDCRDTFSAVSVAIRVTHCKHNTRIERLITLCPLTVTFILSFDLVVRYFLSTVKDVSQFETYKKAAFRVLHIRIYLHRNMTTEENVIDLK